jgi:peptidoglycan/LPS O-acetylase OafA/YrhL
MWSIAVEEQFYLLWPWLILLLPELRLRTAIVAAILMAPLARGILSPINSDAVYRLTICRTDLLGLGALIAWIDLHDPTWLARYRNYFLAAGGVAVAVFTALSLALPTFELEQRSTLYSTLGFSLEAATFTCVLVIVRLENSGPLYRLLRFPPLEFLGRISYMAYLCHVLCLHLVKRLELSGPLTVALGLTATIAFSSASWYLMEQPLQRLRGFVPLRSRAAGSTNSDIESPRAGEMPGPN